MIMISPFSALPLFNRADTELYLYDLALLSRTTYLESLVKLDIDLYPPDGELILLRSAPDLFRAVITNPVQLNLLPIVIVLLWVKYGLILLEKRVLL